MIHGLKSLSPFLRLPFTARIRLCRPFCSARMQEIYGRNHCYRAIFLRAEDSRKAYSCVIYCFRHYCRKSNGEKNVALFDRNLLFCCMLCTVKSLSRKIDIQSTGSLWYNRLYTYPIRIARSYNPALTHRIHGVTFI